MLKGSRLYVVVRAHILRVCVWLNWNIPSVAESLGVSVKTVYNRLHWYERDGFVVKKSRSEWGLTTAGDDIWKPTWTIGQEG